MDIFIHLNIHPLSWDMPNSEAPPPRACASLCRLVRRRGAASSDHTAHPAASLLTPLPDTSCDGTASVSRVSLGCDASGLSTCVWREGEAACGNGENLKKYLIDIERLS